jgi:hypothetical protein
MNTSRLIIISVITVALALVLNIAAFFIAGNRAPLAGTSLAPAASQNVEGFCFVRNRNRGEVVVKTTYLECLFGGFGGSQWCQDIGISKCYFPLGAEQNQSTLPTQPTGQTPQTPVEQSPAEDERPGGYLNEPFGGWSEPGYCLANDQRQFDIFEYEGAIDCIEKVPEGQACDYLNECFADQRSLVDYLQQFTQ